MDPSFQKYTEGLYQKLQNDKAFSQYSPTVKSILQNFSNQVKKNNYEVSFPEIQKEINALTVTSNPQKATKFIESYLKEVLDTKKKPTPQQKEAARVQKAVQNIGSYRPNYRAKLSNILSKAQSAYQSTSKFLQDIVERMRRDFSVSVDFTFYISNYEEERNKRFVLRNILPSQVLQEAQEWIAEYLDQIPSAQTYEIENIQILQINETPVNFSFPNQVLGGVVQLEGPQINYDIIGSMLENETINFCYYQFEQIKGLDNNIAPEDTNCFLNMIQILNCRKVPNKRRNFPTDFILDVKELGNNVLVKDVIRLCQEYKIEFEMYNVKGEIIKQYKPPKNATEQIYKSDKWDLNNIVLEKYPIRSIKFLFYDNHCYGLNPKSPFITQLKQGKTKIPKMDNVSFLEEKMFDEMFKIYHATSVMKGYLYEQKVKHFIYRGFLFAPKNSIINQIRTINQHFMLKEVRKITYNVVTLFFDILKNYDIKLNKSLIIGEVPKNTALIKQYRSPNSEKYSQVDANKQYPSIFWSLRKLTFINQTRHSIYDYKGQDLEPYENKFVRADLYYELNDECHVLRNQMYYLEDLILLNTDKFHYKIYQVIECEYYENRAKEVIKKFYDFCQAKDCMKAFKDSMNRFIGCLGQVKKIEKSKLGDIRIFNESVLPTLNPNTSRTLKRSYKIADQEFYLVEEKTEFPAFNEKRQVQKNNISISWQIISNANIRIIQKAQELNQKGIFVDFINTDAIYFQGEIPEQGYDPNKFNGYKLLHNQEIKVSGQRKTIVQPIMQRLNLGLVKKFIKIFKEYAGEGKTTRILKQKPELVFSPQYTCLEEYKEADVPCHVMAFLSENIHKLMRDIPVHCASLCKGTVNDFFRTVKVIYIDEFFLCDSDIYYIMYCLNQKYGHKFMCYGDDKQLEHPFNYFEPSQQYKDQFIEYVIKQDFLNHRNTFTKEQYDKLINYDRSNYKQHDILYKIYQYYTTPTTEHKNVPQLLNENLYVLCRTKEQIKQFYEKYVQTQKMEHFHVGQRVRGKENEEGLYNKQIFIIVNKDWQTQEITVRNRKMEEYTFTFEEFEKKFEQSQFVTIHSMQGKSCDIKIAKEVFMECCRKKQPYVYTVLSRSNRKLDENMLNKVEQLFKQL